MIAFIPWTTWAPSVLFASGEEGAWYDPSDLSTLAQNANGTGAVAVDDPVGFMADKSGNGNHATQATSGARPILRQDGNDNYYLEFDGSDDFLDVPALGIAGAQSRELQLAGQANAVNAVFFNIGPKATGERWCLRRFPSSTALRLEIEGSGYNSAFDASALDVFGVGFSGTTLADNTLYAGTSSEAASGAGSVDTTDSDTLICSDTVNAGDVSLYGLAIIGRVLAAGERALPQQYLAAKAAVSL